MKSLHEIFPMGHTDPRDAADEIEELISRHGLQQNNTEAHRHLMAAWHSLMKQAEGDVDENTNDPYARDPQTGQLLQPGTQRTRPDKPTQKFEPHQLPKSGPNRRPVGSGA